jgi:hypothetical protein
MSGTTKPTPERASPARRQTITNKPRLISIRLRDFRCTAPKANDPWCGAPDINLTSVTVTHQSRIRHGNTHKHQNQSRQSS